MSLQEFTNALPERSVDTECWHLFQAYDEETDMLFAVTAGPTGGPDAVLSNGKRLRDLTLPFGEMIAVWVACFDHEPSEKELDEFKPVGHRSTDVDED